MTHSCHPGRLKAAAETPRSLRGSLQDAPPAPPPRGAARVPERAAPPPARPGTLVPGRLTSPGAVRTSPLTSDPVLAGETKSAAPGTPAAVGEPSITRG